jgi:hypothetical protein
MNCENHECITSYSNKKISWPAIFVGALVGIGIGFLLNLFGIAIGLSVLSVNDGAVSMAIGGLIGIAISVIVSSFMTGLIASYVGCPESCCARQGILYGFTAWSVSLILMAAITVPLGTYALSYAKFITKPAFLGHSSLVISEGAQSADIVTVDTHALVTEAAFLVFFLFFLGAFSSTLGGYLGTSCRKCDKQKCEKKCDDVNKVNINK